MFTLAISCLTTSSLPGFMDLTPQVPMQCCSLQHHALLLPPGLSTTGPCFRFGSASSPLWIYLYALLQEHVRHLPIWEVHPSASYSFAFSCYSWGSQGKNTELVFHFLRQWTMCCQTSPALVIKMAA